MINVENCSIIYVLTYVEKGKKHMRKLIEALNELKGQDVYIYIEHKLFGSQCIIMQFEPETEIGFGFHFREQVIYIDKDDVVDYCVDTGKIHIDGGLMSMEIVKAV